MPTADELFRAEVDRRGIAYSVTPEGLYDVDSGGKTLSISLENIRRNYERDGNCEAIIEFVDLLKIDYFGGIPSWDEVQPYLRYSLEPIDQGTVLDEALFDRVTNGLCKVYVYMPPDESFIQWINHFTVEGWGVSRDEIVRQAESNMRDIVERTTFEVTEVDGVKLGMLSTEDTPFKASLILSPSFRDLVSPEVGWPVYVVVPCRDFAYVISATDRDFLGRMGGIVIKQYRKSAYPITKDVLEVSDRGIAAIGTYPEPE